METHYLPDATDFTDIPAKLNPSERTDGARMAGSFVLCPVCHGHGCWNLLLNRYGPGQHFQAFCRQCWGWGWVEDGTCVHDFREVAPDQPFRCWHTERCTKCGRTRSYSSDD